MDNDKKQKEGWVRLASKSRPGRFYLFNKATGDTQWLPLKTDDVANEKEESPPKLLVNKFSKTPAQDRLKRLQHSLKLCHTKSTTSNTKPKTLKEQTTTELRDGPSTSLSTRTLAKSPKKLLKRSHGESLVSEKIDSVKCAKYSVEENPKTLPLPDSSTSNLCRNGSVEVHIRREEKCTTKELLNNEKLQHMESNSSKFTNIRSSIVKKIKEMCKIPFNVPKKIDDKSLSKNDRPSGIINTTKFKKTSKTKSKQSLLTSITHEAIGTQIREEIPKSIESKTFVCSPEKITPKIKKIPSYERGSANSRLERLKQSLLLQQQSFSTKDGSDRSIVIETNNNKTTLFQKDYQSNSNETTNSSDDTAGNTINDGVEAMDWQPITKEESVNDNSTFKPTVVVEKSKKLLLKEVNGDENQTMGDIIDTVNENLLRFSAEKQKESINKNRKWRKDFYYFIVDTNVLLKDLTFIEDLSKMKLCDTKGSMLYIPYSVLQELDKLKMRSGSQEGVKTLAVRAIKYLNSKLTNNSSHIQAQSAVEERQHLIEVNSADDSIINCCLQTKEHVPNLLFLTEDVNLRNKAICNNIIVSTKADLIAKRYDSSDIS